MRLLDVINTHLASGTTAAIGLRSLEYLTNETKNKTEFRVDAQPSPRPPDGQRRRRRRRAAHRHGGVTEWCYWPSFEWDVSVFASKVGEGETDYWCAWQ